MFVTSTARSNPKGNAGLYEKHFGRGDDIHKHIQTWLTAVHDKQFLALYRAGNFGEALPHAKQVLALREELLGATHADTVIALENLKTIN